MELTEEQRIAIIKHAHLNSKKVSPSKSVEDFLEEIKSEELLGENGLFNVHENDIEDEIDLFGYTPQAENIDEEDFLFGLSPEMRGIYS